MSMGETLIGKMVLVRDHLAGVHIGRLVALDVAAGTVELEGAIKMWRWQTVYGPSCHDLATVGARKADCQISAMVARVCTRNLVEILPLTETAATSVGL